MLGQLLWYPIVCQVGCVTDKGTRMCVDPGGNGATMNAGGEGDRARLAGGRWAVSAQQWRQVDVHRMPEDKEDGLGPTSRLLYAQSMYHCVCQSTVTLMIVIVYLSICLRRINHVVVKNHLHSSSDVQEVVSGTIRIISFAHICQEGLCLKRPL
jgi:hypothetical protein